MKFLRNLYIQLIFLLFVTFFYCEYLIYYVVISQCSWPVFQNDSNDSMVKAMLLADTHLLGPYKGHWFDKLRREWQMYRSFQSAVHLYEPEVVFFLGDLFDEGIWCQSEEEFKNYVNRFFSVFRVPQKTQMYFVPGNHDIGFHDEIFPDLLYDFEYSFNSSSVQLLNLKGNYFILINSMAMEGDDCYLCKEAEERLKLIARELKCTKQDNCPVKNLGKYSRPIILQHFPMYRKSDAKCNERDEAPPHLKNVKFKQKWDCLSKAASEMIYSELNPRAIFTGHVHHGCHTVHKRDIHEYTLPSFSWRNKNNPTFTLAKITPEKYNTIKCDLPKETTVIFIYTSVILGSVILGSQFVYKIIYKKKVKEHTM